MRACLEDTNNTKGRVGHCCSHGWVRWQRHRGWCQTNGVGIGLAAILMVRVVGDTQGTNRQRRGRSHFTVPRQRIVDIVHARALRKQHSAAGATWWTSSPRRLSIDRPVNVANDSRHENENVHRVN
jgi:hypothetical protein